MILSEALPTTTIETVSDSARKGIYSTIAPPRPTDLPCFLLPWVLYHAYIFYQLDLNSLIKDAVIALNDIYIVFLGIVRTPNNYAKLLKAGR